MKNESELLTIKKSLSHLKNVQNKNVKEPLALNEIKKIRDIPINFIVSKERSGTTLLQIILNSHPNISAPPESRFIMLLYSRYGKIKRWTEKDLTNFCNDLFLEKAFNTFWDNNRESLRASILAAKEIATFSLLCKIVFYHFSKGKDTMLFFDKNPVHCYFIPQLKKIFPDAKYIHLVRDYRANVVSHRRVFFIKKSTDISYKWLKMNMEIEKAKRISPESFFTLKYEDLTNYTSECLQNVCVFLDIPLKDNIISKYSQNIYSTYLKNEKPRFRKIHQHLFNPITPDFTDEWKRELNEKDVMLAEKVAGKYAELMYGYPLVTQHNPTRININKSISMWLKYWTIKRSYLLILNNPRLYFFVTKHIWKNF